ncbi:hypothetical protein DRQ16_00245 [bacterium]|nr:MAG: hypothetical protein DRQ16_00245 [bacterium]
MEASLLVIGDEVVSGLVKEINITLLSRILEKYGIKVRMGLCVRDHPDEIKKGLDVLMKQTELVILTGGLGPTPDDITLKTVSEYFNLSLVESPELLSSLPCKLRTQAMVPEGAEYFKNPYGTAPGFLIEKEKNRIILLPGVPSEAEAILPEILEYMGLKEEKIKVVIRTFEIPEVRILEVLSAVLSPQEIKGLSFLPGNDGVRIWIKEGDVEDIRERIYDVLEDYVYGEGDETLEKVVGRMLKEGGFTLACAESCTGGLLMDLITNVPGSSEYFMGGIVSYSNESKIRELGVRRESLEKHGAVSEAVAKEMAQGVRELYGTDFGLSTTGIAGPTGGTGEKPVGLVWMGISARDGTRAQRRVFKGKRRDVKEKAVYFVLNMLRKYILDLERTSR